MTAWWETQPDDPPGFGEWLRLISNYDPHDPGEINAGIRRWFREYFNAEGATSAELAAGALAAHQVAVVADALATVLSDLHRTTAERPAVVVEEDARMGVRIAIDGGYGGNPVWGVEQPAVLAEVAEYIQDQLQGVAIDGNLRIWPDCSQHNVGLHAEVYDGRAVWWCRLGNHELAPIGQLETTNPGHERSV